MGKATELDDFLERQPPLTQEELDRRAARPKLRLRSELLEQALSPTQPVQAALEQLSGETGGKRTVLGNAESSAIAVAVPLERYLELVASYIKDRGLANVTVDYGVIPSDATFAELGVEQVDPEASWMYFGD